MAARLPQATFARWHRAGRWEDGGGGDGGGGGGAAGGAGSHLCEAIKPPSAAGTFRVRMACSTLPFISLTESVEMPRESLKWSTALRRAAPHPASRGMKKKFSALSAPL